MASSQYPLFAGLPEAGKDVNSPAESELGNDLARPVLKWAGGKQQIVHLLKAKVPPTYGRYIEPFFGGGALFFALQPHNAVVSDSNPELINLYRTLVSDVERVIAWLSNVDTSKTAYYRVRSLEFQALEPVEAAARTIYLNRLCFNGLYRVNRYGQFNVPYGRYKNPRVCDPQRLRIASEVLRNAKIVLGDYQDVLKKYARRGDFVYLDPPYVPIAKYSDFKRYTKEQFREEDHAKLAAEVERLHKIGCHVVLTNSNHPVVRELYAGFSVTVVPTRRSISKKGNKRRGEDLIVTALPKRPIAIPASVPPLPGQANRYPPTRFMGSKQSLLAQIWSVASHFRFESVIDLFSGSGAVAYMFKAHGKRVLANDYMAMCALFARAMIQNSTVVLNDRDVERILRGEEESDGFVEQTFEGLYFSDEENAQIGRMRANIKRLRPAAKRAIATTALIRACMKKRPRGIFTYTGKRYDDGRRDLKLSLESHFREAVDAINSAVFDNGMQNKARRGDALTVRWQADLVYIDPPYYTPLSDNEYVRRYHFVEGIARDWKGVEIQWNTKTRKFKSYPTPFSSRTGATEAFDRLFKRFRDSIILVSYSSNCYPDQPTLVSILKRHKRNVEVVSVKHRYSFGTHAHKVGNGKNRVHEYLFVGY